MSYGQLGKPDGANIIRSAGTWNIFRQRCGGEMQTRWKHLCNFCNAESVMKLTLEPFESTHHICLPTKCPSCPPKIGWKNTDGPHLWSLLGVSLCLAGLCWRTDQPYVLEMLMHLKIIFASDLNFLHKHCWWQKKCKPEIKTNNVTQVLHKPEVKLMNAKMKRIPALLSEWVRITSWHLYVLLLVYVTASVFLLKLLKQAPKAGGCAGWTNALFPLSHVALHSFPTCIVLHLLLIPADTYRVCFLTGTPLKS